MLVKVSSLINPLSIAVITSVMVCSNVFAEEQNGEVRYPIPAPGFAEAECIEEHDPQASQLQRCDDTAQHYCGNLDVAQNQIDPPGNSCPPGWILCSWNCSRPAETELSLNRRNHSFVYIGGLKEGLVLEAWGVNDSGEIVGRAHDTYTFSVPTNAFVLLPVE